jgi:hypothetical protein
VSVETAKSSNRSAWDILYDRADGPQVATAYAKVFWPDLIEIDGYVLLAENCDRGYLNRIVAEHGREIVEATINTTYLPTVFGPGPTEVADAVWEELGRLVCEAWKARAEQLFPGRKFITEFQWYSEHEGDPGVTLRQAKPVP